MQFDLSGTTDLSRATQRPSYRVLNLIHGDFHPLIWERYRLPRLLIRVAFLHDRVLTHVFQYDLCRDTWCDDLYGI